MRLQEGNIIHHLERVQGYKPYLGKLKAVTSDMKVQDIPKFEKQKNLAISVYTVKEKEKPFTPYTSQKCEINLQFNFY